MAVTIPKHVRKNFLRARYHTVTALSKANYLKVSLVVLGISFIAVSGAGLYGYNLYQQSQAEIKKLQTAAKPESDENKRIVALVAKHMVLPNNETPTIGTVTDSTKLQSKPFFAKASNGDKVLIYTKNKKAILYNPAQKKVVEVTSINSNKKTDVAGLATQITPTQSVQPTVQIQRTRIASPSVAQVDQ